MSGSSALTRTKSDFRPAREADRTPAGKLDLERLRACCSQEDWLQALLRVRYGAAEIICPGCGRRSPFKAVASQRALACQACGHRILPCAGTPLEKPQRALCEWLLGARLIESTGGMISAKDLQAEIGCTYKAAWRMEQELRPFLASEQGSEQVGQWLRAMEACLAAGPRPSTTAGLPHPAKAAVAAAAPAEVRAPREPSWLARRIPSARTRSHIVVFGGLAAVTALAIALASLLTDRSGRIDTAAAPELAAPPSLTLAILRSSVRLSSPAVEALLGDELPDAVEVAAVEDRKTYDTIIREGTAPGPRDPNEVLQFGPIKVRRHIVETIVRAARETKADPVLLMAIADKESSFSTAVKAKTSSATGLYQFIEKTWLSVVREFGPKHGLASEAKAILRRDDDLVVDDPKEKERILDLRRDPYLSALLAAEMLNRDRLRIGRRIGRDLTHGEVYLAHFLGPDGAERFMQNLVAAPTASAAELLPRPARANKPIFFVQDGGREKALSMAEVHKKFEAMMGTRLDRYRNVSRVALPLAFAPPPSEPVLVLRIGKPSK
jgi:soluble lytic murein transglycosylase-like protein/DNA-directed RNA polymerase subunit RPC12/RpoP